MSFIFISIWPDFPWQKYELFERAKPSIKALRGNLHKFYCSINYRKLYSTLKAISMNEISLLLRNLPQKFVFILRIIWEV